MEAVRPHSEPSDVNVEEGQVIVDGPDGVAVTFMPDAARETGHRMIDAAARARDDPEAPGAKPGVFSSQMVSSDDSENTENKGN